MSHPKVGEQLRLLAFALGHLDQDSRLHGRDYVPIESRMYITYAFYNSLTNMSGYSPVGSVALSKELICIAVPLCRFIY